MQSIILVIHLMIAIAMIGVVLLQRSEGGALGIGGGGGGGGFMSGRGTANLLTRITAGLAVLFFVTSISLSLIGREQSGSVFDRFDPNVTDIEGGGGLLLGDERRRSLDSAPAPDGAEAPTPEEGPAVPLSQ